MTIMSHQIQNTNRDRNYRKNSREILDLNGTVTKMKNSQEGFL